MGNERLLIKVEKKIKGKMLGIKNRTITPKESNIGFLFNTMKNLDEALYEKLISEYKIILGDLKKNEK
jgi:hypothetical protein